MTTSALRYAKPNAQIRAMLSQLLSTEEKQGLLGAANLEDAVRQLEGTFYGTRLGEALRGHVSISAVERDLDRGLLQSYLKVISILFGAPRNLVVAMLHRRELEDVKVILRAIVKGASRQEAEALILPLGPYPRVPSGELLKAETIQDAVEILAGTPYGRVLKSALDRFTQEHSLFPVEMALDLDYYRRLWHQVEDLTGNDKKVGLKMLGIRYDTLNIDWLVRFRIGYRLSAEEIFNYTLPYGYRVDDETIRRAALAPDFAILVASLPDPYRSLLSGIPAQTDVAQQAELTLARHLAKVAERALLGYPFQIGVVLAYLWLREFEVRDLKAIFEGKRYGLPAEHVADLMVSRGR